MEQTVQQQLEAVGHQLTVEGIEFNAEYNEADHDGYSFLIGKKKVQIFWMMEKGNETHFDKWIMKYGAIFGGTPLDVHFTAPTIESACLEALRLCREKLAELGKALGMAMYDDEPSGAGLRNHLLKHPDREKIESACRHRLGVDINWENEIKDYLDKFPIEHHGLDVPEMVKAIEERNLLNQPTGEKDGKNEL